MRSARRIWAWGLVACLAMGLAGWAAETRTVVINEVELNPNGFDRDAEWVELLNVGTAFVDLAGWSLTCNYPEEGAVTITTESLILRPGQRTVFVYPGLRLRNEEAFLLCLLDATGAVIEEVGPFQDDYDDAMTWQRISDGGDPLLPIWLLRAGTRNAPNK